MREKKKTLSSGGKNGNRQPEGEKKKSAYAVFRASPKKQRQMGKEIAQAGLRSLQRKGKRV